MKFHLGKNLSKYNPLIVGVVNLSPESFYKGSIADKITLKDKIEEFTQYQVDCIDVGGMSTRPVSVYGGKISSKNEELKRIREFLPEIMDLTQSYKLPVSLDTQYTETAEFGINQGVSVINDISGLKQDKSLAGLIADHDLEVVLMATDNLPGDVCGFEAAMNALISSIDIANQAGINRSKISIDPGFGGWQGRSSNCDLDLIKNFHKFQNFKLPIYIGVSRKSTIGALNGGNSPDDRLFGSLQLTTWLVENGANIVRTHDVKETRLALNVWRSICDLTSSNSG